MISHMISQLCDITVWLWYHSQTMISHMMSCMYIMWCSSTSYMMSWVISHCDITIMWYHRENTVISHVKSQATKRLIISDITFIFHIICDITYDITVMCQWYHTVMSHVITHLVLGSSSRLARSGCRLLNQLVVVRGLKHKPLVNARPLAATASGLGGVGGVGGNCGCLAFDEWPAGSHYCCTAAKPPKLLRSRQRPALPERQRSAWNDPETRPCLAISKQKWPR